MTQQRNWEHRPSVHLRGTAYIHGKIEPMPQPSFWARLFGKVL